MNYETTQKRNVPIKIQIKKMEETIAELKKDINENKKNGLILKSENESLNHRVKEKCNEITKLIIDDLSNLDKDFRRIISNDKNETDFFKQQVNSLIQEKTNLQQKTIVLETRIRQCENDIGIDFH
jgi:hypothetical protein